MMNNSDRTDQHRNSHRGSSLRHSLQSKIDYANMPPIYKIPLYELDFYMYDVKRKHSNSISLRDAIQNERKNQDADVTVFFAIRQVGWAGCREHGRQLAELAAEDPKIALAGTVKETSDEEGLVGFYETYFDRHTLYNDEKWRLYHAMGGRKVGLWSLTKAGLMAFPRFYKKGIVNSTTKNLADPWMLGGVLVFDQKGNLVYAMEESPGEELSMDRLKRAIRAARTLNESGEESSRNDLGEREN